MPSSDKKDLATNKLLKLLREKEYALDRTAKADTKTAPRKKSRAGQSLDQPVLDYIFGDLGKDYQAGTEPRQDQDLEDEEIGNGLNLQVEQPLTSEAGAEGFTLPEEPEEPPETGKVPETAELPEEILPDTAGSEPPSPETDNAQPEFAGTPPEEAETSPDSDSRTKAIPKPGITAEKERTTGLAFADSELEIPEPEMPELAQDQPELSEAFAEKDGKGQDTGSAGRRDPTPEAPPETTTARVEPETTTLDSDLKMAFLDDIGPPAGDEPPKPAEPAIPGEEPADSGGILDLEFSSEDIPAPGVEPLTADSLPQEEEDTPAASTGDITTGDQEQDEIGIAPEEAVDLQSEETTSEAQPASADEPDDDFDALFKFDDSGSPSGTESTGAETEEKTPATETPDSEEFDFDSLFTLDTIAGEIQEEESGPPEAEEVLEGRQDETTPATRPDTETPSPDHGPVPDSLEGTNADEPVIRAGVEEDELIGGTAPLPLTEDDDELIGVPVTKTPGETEAEVPVETTPEESRTTGAEEGFEDDLADEKTGPVTFIYQKKKLLDLGALKKILSGGKERIGLDIGRYAIKYVVAHATGGVTTIDNFGYIVIPAGIRSDTRKYQDFVARTIKEILESRDLKKEKLNLSLDGSEIGIKSIRMPKVGKKELKEAVRWSTRKQLSFSADEAIIDFKIISEVTEEGVPKLDILVIAALNTLVDDKIKSLSELKIPRKITLLPLAAWQFFMSSYPMETARNVVILDIGHETTFINILNENVLRFAREINIAGREFTQALVGSIPNKDGKRITIDEDQAENLKHSFGLPLEKHEQRATDEGILLEQIASRIRSPLEKLANEVQRSIQYYGKEFPYGAVEKIYICGGSAALLNLDGFLRDYLQLDVIICDPIQQWDYGKYIDDLGSLQTNAKALAIPAGIALDTSQELNLLPEKMAQEAQNYFLRFLFKSFIFIIIGATLTVSTITSLKSKARHNELTGIEAQLESLSPLQKEVISLQMNRKDISDKLRNLKSMYAEPSLDVQVLKILSNLMPENILLNSLTVNEPGNRPVKAQVAFSGYILANPYEANVKLAEFIMHLENSGYTSNVSLLLSQPFENETRSGLFFEVECEVVNDAG